jgi:hypothetical protein
MKTIAISILILSCLGNLSGADSEKPEASPKSKPKLTQEQLEAKFKATLTKAVFSGRWCSILPDGQASDKRWKLGPNKEDKYTIVGVSRIEGDSWVIRSRIQYGKVDVVAPIPIQVKWAGDTPVIIVDNISIPGGGTYSARVMVYDNTYAGSWSGGDHAGLLNGVINSDKDTE